MNQTPFKTKSRVLQPTMLAKFTMGEESTKLTMTGDHRRDDAPIEQKVAAERDEEFVVFHIGLRINAFWKIHRWLPIFLLAPRMVRELISNPKSGLLGSRTVVGPGIRNIGFIQYWDSFEALHLPAVETGRR